MKLTVNKKAPDFMLKDQNGTGHSLKQYLGSWVLLYFYPKDDTPGCTKEACGIRDRYKEFVKNKIIVLGVSKDSASSHGKFVKKYNLPFILLADEDKKVIKLYHAWGKKKMMGREYMGTKRISYLIDPRGKISKIYLTVKPLEHAGQVLYDIDNS